jgi:hypothetical protein
LLRRLAPSEVLTVTTDRHGHAVFDVTLDVATAPGEFISATATDPFGNTSEFSADQRVRR